MQLGIGLGLNQSRRGVIPFDLSKLPGLVALYDAEFVELIGSKVRAWLDRSGNDNHAIQDTEADQPSLDPTGIGGKPALDFAGARSSLAAPNSLSLNTITGPFAVYCVINSVVNPDWQHICGKELLTNDGWAVMQKNSTRQLVAVVSDGVGELDASPLTFPAGDSVLEFFCDVGTVSAFTANGISLGAVPNYRANIMTNTGTFKIGERAKGIQSFDGKLSKLLLLNRLPSIIERNNIVGSLANGYELPWTKIAA